MDGRCRPSPHRGHYWVEEIRESDKWQCRWCGKVRHFNQERIEKEQTSELAVGASEYASQQWLHRQADQRTSKRIGEGPLESDLRTYLFLSTS